MPAPVAPLIGFALGVLFAWAAADELARPSTISPTLRRVWVLVGLFSLLVFAPATAYFAVYEADWAYAYLFDTQRFSKLLIGVPSVFGALSIPAGFAMAARALRSKQPGALLGLGLVPAAVAALFLLITLPRLAVRATFAQYHGDFGIEPVSATPLGYALAWMTLVMLCAGGWTANALGQLSRRS